MRRMTFAALAALILSLAWRPAAASNDRMSLLYEVYSGGFHVLNFELDLALAPERYDVTARINSAGFVGWFLSWRQVSESRGALGPETYSSGVRAMGTPRTLTLLCRSSSDRSPAVSTEDA